MIYEVEKNYLTSYLRSLLSPAPTELPLSFGNDQLITLTSSGKAALHLILEWLRSQKILRDKTDTILTPRWLGNWVYKTIHQTALPTDIPSHRTRAVLVYHQYGFPQNMDVVLDESRHRGLVIIEDCAHALWSFYHQRRLGTFGEFSLFSFPKFFPLLMGGAIITKNKNAHDFFQTQLKISRNRYRPFLSFSKYLSSQFNSLQTKELLEMSYALYPYQTAISRSASKIVAQNFPRLKDRQRNYQIVKDIFKSTDFLAASDDEVTPYVVPLTVPPRKLNGLVNLIKRLGYFSGAYHFDINRNLFNPNFIPVAWLPVHQGIIPQSMKSLSITIKKYLLSPN